MNVISCYKIVPDEQDIVVLQDRNLSLERAEWKIGQYDLNAVEVGMQIVEAVGGKVSALSVGDKQLENSKLKKGILSRGPEELFLVVDERLGNADAYLTAKALKAGIDKIGSFDLVLCGEGSGDLYSQQVGIQLGELLNVPTLNAVSKITPAGDKLVVERTLENEIEVLEVMLPAVISVTTDINQPRIPSMKNILAAGKKTVTQWGLSDLGTEGIQKPTEILSTLAPEQVDRKQIIFEGDSEEVVQKLFENIQKELL
ncbi:electron transfer flavoprotein [Desulfitobacterium sp.]|uniref:electron transfer flavoprotein n=1 Tax=Desulfitobacterium sp. TaxID=49981 RepID=UPI002B912325|nr:electron transfer flavoprotein [Desulfitobacterium sp.]HVJ48683.1 electron transfer flavoprotein [Desulfitobacterium sp.]